MKHLTKVWGQLHAAWENRRFHRWGRCPICGWRGPFYAFDAALPEEMLLCPVCRSISRNRRVARLLLDSVGLAYRPSVRAARGELVHFKAIDTSGNGPLSRVMAGSSLWLRGAYSPDRPPHRVWSMSTCRKSPCPTTAST